MLGIRIYSSSACSCFLVALYLICSCWSGAAAVRLLGAGPSPVPDNSDAAAPGVGGAAAGAGRFVMAGQPVQLQCRFALDPDETLAGVTWTKDSQLVYRWLPHDRVTALGELENAVEPATPGWNIYIPRSTISMAGNYSCSVHTDRGSAASRRFKLLIILVCKARIETEDSTGVNCTVGWRISCSRIFPELNLTAGIFLPEQGKFFDKVTEWTKVVYSDNTFGYNTFKSYHVADIPKSSIFLWSLNYKDKISLVTGNVSFGAVHRSGCSEPPPVRSHGMQVHVSGALTTCRGELVAKQDSEDGKMAGSREARSPDSTASAPQAVYSCINSIPHGEHSEVKVLVCDGGQWIEQDINQSWPEC